MLKIESGSHFDYITGAKDQSTDVVPQMANTVEPYQFEPLMTPEKLEAFRERTRSRRKGSSDDEEGEDNKSFEFKNSWGCRPPHSNYLDVFPRFRRTFAEVITFVGASAHEF